MYKETTSTGEPMHISPKLLTGTSRSAFIRSAYRRVAIFITGILAYCSISTLFISCSETDTYYEELKDTPEVLGYDPAYTFGDVMEIRGRLNDPEVTVHIGDARAEVLGIEKIAYRGINRQGLVTDSIQLVKVRINEAMGVGENRPVRITNYGRNVNGTPIEIVEGANDGVLPGELTVSKIADYPTGANPIFCRSGNGSMYFIHQTNFAVTKVDSTGVATEVFNAAAFKDNDGAPFTVTAVNGAGIDPGERYLYLSVYTQGTGSVLDHYYRLVRWNLREQELVVMNKTPYSRLVSRHTLAAAQPFEGQIENVKMFDATAIYPDNKDNIFFQTGGRFRTYLRADGSYSYLFKSTSVGASGVPQIHKPGTQGYYSARETVQLFPGVGKNDLGIRFSCVIHPDEMPLYDETFGAGITPGMFRGDASQNARLYISGSFNLLTFPYEYPLYGSNRWGHFRLPGERLLILYNYNVWGIIDIAQQRGYRYAPGTFDLKGYTLRHERGGDNDRLLNYDDKGMLYLTATDTGGNRVILKTVYK